mgnify:CR=1 FL=1
MYSPLLLDHAVHPRNTGPLPGPTHVGEARYERCGDRMRLEFLVADGRVREVRGQTFGCGAAVAAASVATELRVFPATLPTPLGRPVAWSRGMADASLRARRSVLVAVGVEAGGADQPGAARAKRS